MPDLKHARPAIRQLVRILNFRATFGRPSYIKWTEHQVALIVPHLTNGPDGPYSYLRGFQRATVREAVLLGYVRLGERGQVPAFADVSNHQWWAAHPDHSGRTITSLVAAK
ncbi:hypothetical protein ACWENO_14070 [Streptomyces sp. NPDC004436]